MATALTAHETRPQPRRPVETQRPARLRLKAVLKLLAIIVVALLLGYAWQQIPTPANCAAEETIDALYVMRAHRIVDQPTNRRFSKERKRETMATLEVHGARQTGFSPIDLSIDSWGALHCRANDGDGEPFGYSTYPGDDGHDFGVSLGGGHTWQFNEESMWPDYCNDEFASKLVDLDLAFFELPLPLQTHCYQHYSTLDEVAKTRPFGYRMGQQIEGDPDGVNEAGMSYKFIRGELPHPFGQVFAGYTERTGVCRLGAATKVLHSEQEQIAVIEFLGKQLVETYGMPTRTSKDPYGYYWEATGYRNNIGAVGVQVQPEGYVFLSYNSDVDGCTSTSS